MVLLGDLATIQWQHAVEEFQANELGRRRPDIKGAIAQAGESKIWCIWTRVLDDADDKEGEEEGNGLHIIRLVFDLQPSENAEEEVQRCLEALVREAHREASEWDIRRIDIWNPHPWMVKALQAVTSDESLFTRETDLLPCVWFESSGDPIDVSWIEIQKYGSWCLE